MKKFIVRITETSSKTVASAANSKKNALAIVKKNWENADYVFDERDFDGVKYEIE